MSRSDTSARNTWNARRAKVLQWTGREIVDLSKSTARIQLISAIVSSHDARHPEWTPKWRHRILTALDQIRNSNGVVLFSLEHPIGAWIKDFAMRLGIPSIELATNSSSIGTSTSRDRIVLDTSVNHEVDSDLARLPLVDRLVFALADNIHAIRVRPKSKTEALIKRWTEDYADSDQHHRLFDYSEDAVSTDAINRQDNSDWTLASDNRELLRLSLGYSPFAAPIIPLKIIEHSKLNTDRYLVHCTRGRTGPLPLQSNDSYASEIFLSEGCIGTSPLKNLISILSQRRIVATSHLKKNQIPSVSFSNVPLLELLTRRRYQSHLQRWDWEPYGLAIQKTMLAESFDAQPVLYTDDLTNISADKIWLTQPASHSRSTRDWSLEKEWRVPSDIRLAKLEFTNAFVFVPTLAEAISISHLSPFPIAVVQ